MYSGTSRRLIALVILVQSASCKRPVRMRSESTCASADKIRCVNSVADISSEKNNTGRLVVRAALTAIPNANALLPIAGRAPTMFRVPGCKPERSLSSFEYPVRTPVTSFFASNRSSKIWATAPVSSCSFFNESVICSSPMSNTICSALSIAILISAGAEYPISAISLAPRMRRRSIEVSRTMRM